MQMKTMHAWQTGALDDAKRRFTRAADRQTLRNGAAFGDVKYAS